MRRWFAISLLLGACSMPDDAVLSVAFQLEPPPPAQGRVYPPEADVGLRPFDLGSARGRCTCDVAAATVTCTFERLPPLPNAPVHRYELSLLVGYARLPPRYDGRAVERDPGGHDPDLPPPPMAPPLPRAVLGAVTPDALGSTRRVFPEIRDGLDRVVGGELHVVVPKTDAAAARYLVIDGRVGNLTITGTPDDTPPPAPAGGHMH